MIEFKCSSCRKLFNVANSKAGRKARCPECGTVLTIPKSSTTDLLIYEEDARIFSNNRLNELYGNFLNNNDNVILNHRVIDPEDGGVARLEILTGIGRSQLVFIVLSEEEDDQAFVGIWSRVGEMTELAQLAAALREVKLVSRFSLSLDEKNWLHVSTVRKLKNFDDDEFRDVILTIANFADENEAALLGGIDRT